MHYNINSHSKNKYFFISKIKALILVIFIILLVFAVAIFGNSLVNSLKLEIKKIKIINNEVEEFLDDTIILDNTNLKDKHREQIAFWLYSDQKIVDDIYTLLEDMHNFFTKNNIWYVTSGGTSLGVARHGGLIPWDDDADLNIMNEDLPRIIALKDELRELGYYLTKEHDFNLYKISPVNGRLCDKDDNNTEHTCPFIDLFPIEYNKKDKIYQLTYYKHRDMFPNEEYTHDQLFPTSLRKFGPIYLQTPNKIEEYLDRGYKNWRTDITLNVKHFDKINKNCFSLPLTQELSKPALPSWDDYSNTKLKKDI